MKVVVLGNRLSDLERIVILHPIEAVALTLFDGTRDIDEVVEIISKAFNIEESEAERLVQRVLEACNMFLMRVEKRDKPLHNYNPLDYIFHPEEVNTPFRLSTPISLVYITTFRCLRRCICCFAACDNKAYCEELPFDSLKKIFDEAADIGVKTVSLSGGEPFLRKDIIKIIEYILGKGMYVEISTKARISEECARKLSDIGLPEIQVSIDSHREEIQDKLAGVKGTFRDLVSTIRALVKYDIRVRTNTVITRYNINDIPELVKFLQRLGVSEILLTPYTRSLGRHREDLFPEAEDYAMLVARLEGLKEEMKKAKITLRYEQVLRAYKYSVSPDKSETGIRPMCSAGRLGLVILPDGRVTICERLAHDQRFIVGDLKRESLIDVWNSSKLLAVIYPKRELYKGTVCYNCEEFEKCNDHGRCFVRALLAYGDPFTPDPLCPKSPKTCMRIM